MQTIRDLKNWYGRALVVTLVLVPALLIPAAFFVRPEPCVGGRCPRPTPFQESVSIVGGFTLYATLFLVLWLAIRYWRLRAAERLGLQSWLVPAFKRADDKQTMHAAAAKLADANLLAAAHHPDHSAQAKAVCIEALAARGITPAQSAGWQPPVETLHVPTFLRMGGSPAAVWSYARTFRVFASLVTFAAVAALMLTLIFFMGMVARWSDLATLLALPAALFAFFLLLFLGALVLRGRTLRILLLRPFGERQMTAALKKVVLRKLGGLGHVYTLSDRNYRPNPFMGLLNIFGNFTRYVVSPLVHPSLRIASVHNQMTFFKFAVALSRKLKPSYRSLISAGQAVNIRTTDAWWQRCIDLLMHSTDFIVMDVSRVSAGSAWEIEQLARRALLERCVFIVQEKHQADGLGSIQAALPPDYRPKLHVFRDTGVFTDDTAFDQALETLLRGRTS